MNRCTNEKIFFVMPKDRSHQLLNFPGDEAREIILMTISYIVEDSGFKDDFWIEKFP